MKISAKKAMATTAKLKKVDAQVDLIGRNLLANKYKTLDELKRIKASLNNAYNIARRANDELTDQISSVDDLKELVNSEESTKSYDEAVEATLQLAQKAATIHQAIEGEIDSLEPVVVDEEITDEIIDPEASEEVLDETQTEDEEVVETSGADEDVLDDEVLDDEDVPAVEDEEEEEEEDTVASEDNFEDDEEEPEVEEPVVAKKKVSVATKKASVVKKSATKVSRSGINWTLPALPENRRR